MRVCNINCMVMKPFGMFSIRQIFQLFLLVGIISFGPFLRAQEQNLYCIGVKQTFDSWGSCGDPGFVSASVIINYSVLSSKVIVVDSLNRILTFNKKFYNTSYSKEISRLKDAQGNSLSFIMVYTYANGIANDRELSYNFGRADLIVGDSATLSKSASDPCHNDFNIGGGREGYSMTTTIYIDDPINLTNVNTNENPRYCIGYNLSLQVGSYFDNKNVQKPVLEVALDNGSDDSEWIALKNVNIRPGTTINLGYEDIAGDKDDPNSKYFLWMGRSLKFRIVKTLLNGSKTYGQQVAGVLFYPEGPQYSVLQTKRSSCNLNVVITVKLEDNSDKGYFNLDSSYYKWVVGLWNGTQFTSLYNCEMVPVNRLNKVFDIILKNDKGVEEDPFNVDNTGPVEWKMQLQDVNLGSFFCVRSFTIPPKPSSIVVQQKHPNYLINRTSYDVPDCNHPFAMVSINDDYVLSYLRKPYKIKEGESVLLTLNDLPTDYDELSATQQSELESLFEDEFDKMIKKTNSPYQTYFDLKLRQWAKDHSSTGQPLYITKGLLPVFSPDNKTYLYITTNDWSNLFDGQGWGRNSDGSTHEYYSRFDVYLGSTLGGQPVRLTNNSRILVSDNNCLLVHPNGTDYFYVKRDFNGVSFGDHSIYKATTTGGNGVCISEKFYWIGNLMLSLDGSYLYFVGDPISGDPALYRIPVGNSAVNVATKIIDNVSTSVELSKNGLFFLYQNYSNSDGVYRYDISSGVSTRLSDLNLSQSVRIIPNDQFFLYAKGMAIFCAPVGNTINNGVQIVNGLYAQSTECLHVLKDNVTYLFSEGGTNAIRKSTITNSLYNGTVINPRFKSSGKLAISDNEGFCLSYLSDCDYDMSLLWYDLSFFALDVDKTVNYFRERLYPNQGYAQVWYDEYKAMFRERWLAQQLGVKVTNGIRVNEDQHLKLVDADGCEYPFDIYVKAPPQPTFVVSGIIPPTDGCSHDGTATVTYEGGGLTPYVYSTDSMSTQGQSVTVTGLGYGDNTVYFTDGEGNESASVSIPVGSATVGITGITVTPQTCTEPNGAVAVNLGSVAGTKAYRLTYGQYPYTVYEVATAANGYTFEGLPGGPYTLEVTSGTCYFEENDIVVESQIFDISSITAPDVTTIGGTGIVDISFANRTGTVSWISGAPVAFDPSVSANTVRYTGVVPGTYNLVAQHTDVAGRVCSVSKVFPLNSPKFDAKIDLDEKDDGVVLMARLVSANSLMLPYQFQLLNALGTEVIRGQEGEALQFLINAEGSYTVNLIYDSKSIGIYTFTYPQGQLSCTAQVTTPTCPGGDATVLLSPSGGIDGEGLQVSLDGIQFFNTLSYTTKAGEFVYFVRDENESYSDVLPVTINKTLVKRFSTTVSNPPAISATVIPINVTCNASANGSISIFDPTGGSGVYQYRIRDDGSWKGPSESFSSLIPGQYNVYLKDSQNSCADVYLTTVTLTQPERLELERQVVVQPKCGLNNGSILAEVQGGNGLYRYAWLRNNQPFHQDPIFSNPESFIADTVYSLGDTLRSGSYRLSVVDNMGCTLSAPIGLDVYRNPSVDLATVDARCHGDSNGEVKLSSYSGSGVFTHSTISSSTAANFSTIANPNGSFQNLTSGIYTVSVFDDKGCSAEFGATIGQPIAPLSVVANVLQPVLAMGTATGIIRSTISGGNDGLKTATLKNLLGATVDYSQQREDFPFSINSLYAGNYTVAVVDRKGCEYISAPIQVPEPTSVLSFNVVDKKDALCKSQTGSFTVQATGGWGDYKYKRSTQNSFYNSGKFENLYAGNYVVTVKDRFGATYTDTVALYEPKDSLRAWVAELSNPTCVGNGSVVLGLNGGTAAYKIFNLTRNDSLSVPGVQPVSITGLSAGDNQFRVVDGNGCRFNLETSLNNSQLLQVAFDTPTYPSTSASSDGVLKAVATGGKSPYSYQWSSLFGTPVTGTSATLNGIPSGHYEVNVTEANGCSIAKDIYLPNINDLPLEVCYKRDESSYGANNGYCTLTSSEKNWDSLYIITPSKHKLTFKSTDSTLIFDFRTDSIFLTNLAGGNYFVAGMADGTKYYAEFTIKPYELFDFGRVDVLNASTIGSSNGRITVDVMGGGGGNQFLWERIVGAGTESQVSQDNEGNSVLSNMPAGNYRVTVTDCFGNTISKDIEVDEPSSALMISVAESTNESCKDYTDAFVRLSAGGGWGDYQFRSKKSEYFGNSSLFSDLEVGAHRFYITDRMGVVDSVEVNIAEPSYLTSRIASIDSVSCNGAADGKVAFAVDGGTAPYRFADIDQSNLWIDDNAKGQLSAGKYRYIFTDSNSCAGRDTVEVEIPQPDSLLFNKIEVVHTTCEQDNGSIRVDLKGGALPYSYEWLDSDNKSLGSLNFVGNLMRNGSYTLRVFDKNSCYQELKQRIESSTNPAVTDITTTDVVCYGESNGTATVQNYQYGSPSAPLTFTWSNGNTGLSASGYAKGTHYVTVTDTNNCSTVRYFDVVQPDSLKIAVVNSKMPGCFGYSDAFIEATGVGGVGGYRYLWSTGAETSVLSNIGKGDYGLLVTDANSCEVYGIYPVGEPEELEVDLGDDILMCPGNTRVIDGQEFATHVWSTSQGEVSTERYFTVSKADSYFLEVADNVGCLAHDTIAVAIGNNALVADFLASSQVELTDTLMLFELSNMPLDSMRWDYSSSAFLKVDGDVVMDYIIYLKTLSKGIYNIDLYAYSGGCVSVATKQVEIVDDTGSNPDDDGLGSNPLIKEFTVNPNPNTGDFTATVKLREVADINLVLFSVASGLKANERFEYQLQDYSVPYNLVNLNSGVYLLIVKAGNERRQVKIVIQ